MTNKLINTNVLEFGIMLFYTHFLKFYVPNLKWHNEPSSSMKIIHIFVHNMDSIKIANKTNQMDQYHFISIHWIRHLSSQRIHTEISQSFRSMAVSILFTYWTVYAVGSTWNAWFKSWGHLLCVSNSLHIHNTERTHTHC